MAQLSIQFDLNGEELTAEQTIKACMVACAEKASLNAVTKGWVTPQGEEFSQDAFNKHVDHGADLKRADLESRFQQIFDHQFRKVLGQYMTRQPRRIDPDVLVAAIDFHEQEVEVGMKSNSELKRYTKKSTKTDKYGNRKSCHVLNYLTCSLVKPFRFTLSVHLISQLDDPWTVLTEMTAHLRDNFGISRYLMDRGFFNTKVIEWFESQDKEGGWRYLMPVPQTQGVKPVLANAEKSLKTFKGKYVEFALRQPYTVKSMTGTADTTFSIIARKTHLRHLKDEYFKDANRDRKVFKDSKLIAFASNIDEQLTFQAIDILYRARWGIEIDYRETKRFMPATSSRKVTTRIFWFNLACLFENVLEYVRLEADPNWFDFRGIMRVICYQSHQEGMEMINRDKRRRSTSKSFHDSAMKMNKVLLQRAKS